MKRLQTLALGLLALLSFPMLNAQDTNIDFFHGSWSEVMAKAEKEDKLVFIDCFTDWCGPCKWMAANTFTNPCVAAYFNEHFVNYKLDMEKGEGPEIAKKYSVNAYPTLLFVDHKGGLVEAAVGAKDSAKLMELGESIASGLVPYSKLQAKFKSGDYDRDWLYAYIVRGSDARVTDQDAINEFKKGMVGEAMLEEQNWDIFKRIFRRIDTPQFLYVREHLEDFEEKFGRDEVNMKLGFNYANYMWLAIREKDFDKYDQLRKQYNGLRHTKKDQSLGSMDLRRYKSELPPAKYHRKAAKIMDKYLQNEGMALNNLAWEFYEDVDDAKLLAKAVKWAERSVELGKGYANMDTYGFLLLKTGAKEKGLEVLNEAIEIAKENGQDYSATEKDLEIWLKKDN